MDESVTTVDRMMDFHYDPNLHIGDTPMNDQEINSKLLGAFVEEDEDSWFVKHNGKYVLYCVKDGNIMEGVTGPRLMELLLSETWGRYTNRRLQHSFNFGYKV